MQDATLTGFSVMMNGTEEQETLPAAPETALQWWTLLLQTVEESADDLPQRGIERFELRNEHGFVRATIEL